jgi:hypothetical protein
LAVFLIFNYTLMTYIDEFSGESKFTLPFPGQKRFDLRPAL